MTKDQLIIKGNIKREMVLDGKRFNAGRGFYDALEEKVIKMILDACGRAKANNRNTVFGRDV